MHLVANSALAWIGFCVFILAMLAIDLGVFNRRPHEIGYKDAGIWSAVWVSLALIFAALLFGPLGWELFGVARHQKAIEFLTGYLIELSLSVDNLFVFVLIFSYFKVPSKYQHRVLYWGVLGALVMRVAMILAGTVLINRFHWIVYTSNVFAILGLRTFYFMLAGVVEKFHYLKIGLGIVLGFIGLKMLLPLIVKLLSIGVHALGHDGPLPYLQRFQNIPTLVALGVVAVVLLSSVAASLIWPKEKPE